MLKSATALYLQGIDTVIGQGNARRSFVTAEVLMSTLIEALCRRECIQVSNRR